MEDVVRLLEEYNKKNSQAEQDQILLQPFTYIKDLPGKNIRSKLSIAFNHWMNIPLEKLKAIGEIVQMLHNSSLLIDDIEDNSCLRRGVPVAHSIYGVASTINAANYVFFLALEKVQQLDHPDATKVYTEQLLELHRGQGMEIYWRDNFTCPTESEYKLMTIRKTGGLFMLAIRLMKLFSNSNADFSQLTAILGLYFQIRDDYLNLTSKEYSESKSFCEDLTEGKFSFPIIHAVNNQKHDRQVLHILRQRTKDVEVKKYCIHLMEKMGSFEYCKKTLQMLNEQARAEVANLGPNKYMDTLLDELCTWNSAKT
ncbi:terpene synthase isoform X2 [Sitodiplosis mosellana]|uniref:terpene synthase isoform X2 n=1 Tax=Sitodiplosis mosellana TaxID=263140 RepID=UPI002444C9CF|nr:terpene synthase isoform X2 [Sitodiplosis mosellana]